MITSSCSPIIWLSSTVPRYQSYLNTRMASSSSSLTDEKSAIKQTFLPNEQSEQPTYTPRPMPFYRAHRTFLLVLIIFLPLCLLVKHFGISPAKAVMYMTADTDAAVVRHPHSPNSQISIFSHSNQSTLVPLEAHIMSKCPDARDCLRDLVVPAMEKISDHVNFRLSFIGT